ncbi:uncharacterized protein LOC116340379 [Contarinia nasturtii]|uniref:uncharacterized protein LOC116340379 n=1 Tax=Contarinia nasturtii TaxID=265458 RepID=UPI0012D3EDAD|nr:uncharacterized protein LOC116340379 [Contarinia nasturtii]
MPPTIDKVSATRVRHVNTLKAILEKIITLTNQACSSTLSVYNSELELGWRNYSAAFEEHEKAIAGKEKDILETITAEYATLHGSVLKARISLGKLLAGSGANNTSFLDQTISQPGNTRAIKLPACKLPSFSGSQLGRWVEFKATCRSLLTEQVSDVLKLQHLKEALQDEARDLVAHILPGDGAFEQAMLLLKNRYENFRAITNEQLQRLYTIPKNDPNKEMASTIHQIVNTINSVRVTLTNCGVDVSTWDVILIYNTSQCLHPETLKMWEERLCGLRTNPALSVYIEFLETRITVLETTETFLVSTKSFSQVQRPLKVWKNSGNHHKAAIHYTLRVDYQCVICKRNHTATRCDELGRMPVTDRRKAIEKNNLCCNCLQSHSVSECPFNPSCKKCEGMHHTLLHLPEGGNILCTQELSQEVDNYEILSTASQAHFYHIYSKNVTILATAIVPVRWNGRSILLNALIDQGATTNLISERALRMLGLPLKLSNTVMTGIGGDPVGHVIGQTVGSIGSIHESNYNFNINALVVKRVTSVSPLKCDERKMWSHLHGLPLANPNFTRMRTLDLLLGAKAYAEIVLSNVKKGKPDEPIAQQTKLGWIVFGPAEVDEEFSSLCHALQKEHFDNNPPEDLAVLLQKFWELEEVEPTKHLTRDELAAEQIFVNSVKRGPDGKFIVDLPFKVDPQSKCLGESRQLAEKRLRSSQRRFAKNPGVKNLYDQNLAEYLTLGHMKELESHEIPKNFLPHHPVIKESSSTTKVRTVFDASAITSNGASLNDLLYIGPTIQPDLFDLLIQWRRFRYAFCGDIEKMYRQIWVNPEHALFQCILWQEPDSDQIKVYKLLTVTFGTGSASFQAIRSVDEIGIRVQDTDPELSQTIRKRFYVDDHLGTADDIEKAISLRQRITSELAKYGFNLRKWKANDVRILADLPESDMEEVVNFETTFKTLGVAWQPSTDQFRFNSTTPKQPLNWTKRNILSEIAKLYDPLGWLAPCIVRAKMLMQDLWRLSDAFNWDTPVPKHISNDWQQVYEELCLPIPIQVPRWIGLSSDMISTEIHGFCDAANRAYAASIYLVVKHRDDSTVSNLIASKTKLAPIKTISIPRLELCGAALLSKLMVRSIKSLSLSDYKQYAWCDSKIALAWIAGCPSRWTTFVANRVSQIQKTLPKEIWHHVPSEQNPADIASRGMSINQLSTNNLWWNGPNFLLDHTLWPKTNEYVAEKDIPEQNKRTIILHIAGPQENGVLKYFSDYSRLLRFTAHAMRWKNRVKNRMAPIRAHEISNSLKTWVSIVQNEAFAQDICKIRKDGQASDSNIRQLCPFLDEHGIMRMNGRVGNADMSEQKTAIILPAQHPFTLLLIRHAHEQVLHGGVQLTLRKLREQFWIVCGRNQVKKLIHNCVRCFRFRKVFMKQKMADLPAFRTEQARPFAFVGCDYAGFFQIKTSNRRNAPISKGYIALFICLTTKAIHLELVQDLTTAEFLMAFENFTARRGIPVMFYTDNGTNLTGGSKEIQRWFDQIMSQNNAVTKLFAIKNIQFKTIPARASHMAGIWERAVGSVKYHLRRVLKDTKLNSRQFDYVLKQIEACLNSRPLWAVSTESDDVEVLTPSHFSNFQAINTLPRPDISHIPLNRLDQYQHLYRLYCDFWKIWSKEYLHQFQPRPKWQKEHANAAVDQIVLVAEDNLPPSRWALGKITQVYPALMGEMTDAFT